MVYECNYSCRCSRSCQNRVLQNGVQVKLEVFKTEKKVLFFFSLFFSLFLVIISSRSILSHVCSQGWAVRAREAIPSGTFVCEYVGEVIDEKEADKRRNRFDIMSEGCFHLLVIVQSPYIFYTLVNNQPFVYFRYGVEGWGYLYNIDTDKGDMSRLIGGQVPYLIDAMNYGNVSRYINHR